MTAVLLNKGIMRHVAICLEKNVGAFPDSVNILEGVDNDVRTPEKLIDGVNDTFDGQHMWLAPILPNQVFLFFSVKASFI
ncbi:hypothetical protein PR048_028300 [Dryococelus australis]|uniref:KATNIP domain-containing protein n=1 Tax=Dryococelus australis TaxID=614101 RepID=A0ABQ9GIX3_9NEOP|nr:hypothetical protein PR048_028300 [Dryococelus australis]